MLEDDLGLVRTIVWSFVKQYPGLDFDDLFQEACLVYLEALPQYNPKRGKRTTFMWTVITNHLKTLIHKQVIQANTITPTALNNSQMWSEQETASPEYHALAKERRDEFFAQLSPKAQTICALIFDDLSIQQLANKPKLCRGAITRKLRTRGWAWGPIWNTLRELKNAVSDDASVKVTSSV